MATLKIGSKVLAHPYARLMRLHQRVGIWLLLWPCWWSLSLAGEVRPQVYALFALGAVVMRSAGCIINDMFDREVDAQVERTKTRPLASGEISMRQAAGLLAVLLCMALLVAMALGTAVLFWAACALPLVVAYPLMKRITWWPQLFLGLTFNWGALLGWVAVRGSVELPAIWLYVACIFWTLGYDTIYAHQDKHDDAVIGVKSTALRVGKFTKPFVCACYALFTALIFMLAQPERWGMVMMVCVVLHLLWQVVSVNLDLLSSCKKIFLSNGVLGWLIWAVIIISY